MGKRIFTPQVLADIQRWVTQEGASDAMVAERIGSTPGTVRVQCSKAGIKFRDYTGTVMISTRAYSVLAKAAARRKISLAELAERVLEVVATGGHRGANMVDNLLDDL